MIEPITAQEIRAAFRQARPRLQQKGTIAEILANVSQAHGIATADILGHSRYRPIVAARWDAARRMRTMGMPLEAIGAALNRHHTTIMHAVNKPPISATEEIQ